MNEKPSYYAIIPASVRYCSDLSPNQKLLYGEITALSNKTGECYASNDYFAKLYGVSKRAISMWVSSLTDHGFIDRRMTYKEGTKEVEKRFLTLRTNVPDPPRTNLPYPPEEKCVDNSTRANNTRANSNISIITQANAALVYDHYPKKVCKGAAIKAICSALKKVDLSSLIEAVKDYHAATNKWPKDQKQYIPNCATWMNAERWTDNREEWNRNGIKTTDVGNDSTIGQEGNKARDFRDVAREHLAARQNS